MEPTVEAQMRFVIDLSRRNVEEATGGPFAAAVFEIDSHQLVAAAVNCVVPSRCSIAHAEILAIAAAQQEVGTFDLGGALASGYSLVTSTEPCAMCLGAIPWSGVRRVVCGARAEDAEAVGFDEGPKPCNWVAELEARGIVVCRDVLRGDAAAVLRYYAESGGLIYNGRQGA